mmetsp:Transcript_4589/g.20565  ORF Transcript_4589/g.20565 Transcript_4589/m.20565 type:complete len:90 (-) Transcript_4589:873-1142(-)
MPGAAQSNNLASRDGATSARSGLIRRRAAGANPERNDGNGGNMSMLRYYTDDSPGLKITPVVVLIMSVCFIAFVTMLHAVAKLYQYRSS